MNITEKTTYHDNFFDRLFIWLFSRKMAKALGKTTKLKGYDGFVDLSKQITENRSSKQQQEIVAVVLKSLIPSPVLYVIHTFVTPTKWVCEWNAKFARLLFQWLVGICDVTEVEILDKDNQLQKQKSCLHIRKCRYLEASGCVGMCVNMCKLPTQEFFTNSFNIPVTMIPNFEDFSCEMVFGQYPPPIEQDSVYNQECLLNYCTPDNSRLASCPKVK